VSPDPDRRTRALVDLIEMSTDAEVLRFVPILFPTQITRGLQSGRLCVHELSELKGIYARYPASEADERVFLAREGPALKSAARSLVECSGSYYKKGYLEIPPRYAQSL
jgi:hypothetical protein